MNTENNNGATNVAVNNENKVAEIPAVAVKSPGIKGRKPKLVTYIDKFVAKHGPKGKYGVRIPVADVDAAIAALTSLKQVVVVPPVVNEAVNEAVNNESES